MRKKYSKAAAGTFALNKGEAIHRWYSYLEGYSSCLIDDLINELTEKEDIHSVYDPFGGTGTTPLVASSRGLQSYYSETNPFMREVIESKINCIRRLQVGGIGSHFLKAFLKRVQELDIQLVFDDITWDGFEKFFEPRALSQILQLRSNVNSIQDEDSREIAMIALASIIVRSSRMVRQGDLRFSKGKEKNESDLNVIENYIAKLKDIISDVDNDNYRPQENTTCLCADARDLKAESLVDCVITSPPYLNGTNYTRNTKLELKLTGFITTEKDLPKYHSKGIIAGINNVSKRKTNVKAPDCVIPYIEKLNPVAYDSRIPIMVAGYFQDMEKVIFCLSNVIKDTGVFIMDIGDSQFAGVHIPTHELLAKICEKHGFELYSEDILRERRSKNGMVLSQRLMKFRLHKQISPHNVFRNQAEEFMKAMPYKNPPYNGRNWGHSWHSLCSYHGKLKPAIAHFMVAHFTKPGDYVLDPLCGVGTIPFEACLQGRVGIGNDLSELAFLVSKAKLEKTTESEAKAALEKLKKYVEKHVGDHEIDKECAKYETFGYNGKLPSYFHPDTFREILCARQYFIKLLPAIDSADAMIFSCFLHVLHGNRPYALSRNSHPLTPYAPKGEFIYKNVIEHISDKLVLSYKKGNFEHYVKGQTIFGDYAKLNEYNLQVDFIICSPPFVDSIRFYMQNWMRLWLCGWEAKDFKVAETKFLDQKQKKDMSVYDSFFRMCYEVLKPRGKIILHLGKTAKVDMAAELAKIAKPYFNEVYRADEDVESIEKHGIKDKGATLAHQYLFLMK